MDPQLSRLPGVKPLDMADWLLRDEVFAAQMAYRDALLSSRRADVFACLPEAQDAAGELCAHIVPHCGYGGDSERLTRPDGVEIALASDHPLIIAARLVQMDLCILQPRDGVYHLTAAALCFPSSWMLREKIGRSLSSIHSPVGEYDGKVASSVDRMFGAIAADRPLWRANNLIYTDPELHQPRAEGIAKPIHPTAPRYVRVERQSFLRLPATGVVVFGIHTSLVPASHLSKDSFTALAQVKPDLLPIA